MKKITILTLLLSLVFLSMITINQKITANTKTTTYKVIYDAGKGQFYQNNKHKRIISKIITEAEYFNNENDFKNWVPKRKKYAYIGTTINRKNNIKTVKIKWGKVKPKGKISLKKYKDTFFDKIIYQKQIILSNKTKFSNESPRCYIKYMDKNKKIVCKSNPGDCFIYYKGKYLNYSEFIPDGYAKFVKITFIAKDSFNRNIKKTYKYKICGYKLKKIKDKRNKKNKK